MKIFDFNKFKNNLLKEIGIYLSRKVRENIRKVSYGRRYFYKGRVHIASRPYEPPNIMSGDLIKSVGYKISKNQVQIGEGSSRVNYAKGLELGRQNVKPRPNLVVLFKKYNHDIKNIIENNLQKEIRKNVRKYKI